MRKIGLFSVIFVLVNVLVLSGCGTGSNNTANTPNSSNSEAGSELEWDSAAKEYVMEAEVASGEQALKIWVEYEDYAKALIAAFKVKYPEVKVEYEIVPKVESVERMGLDGEAGKGADVFMLSYDKLGMAIDNATAAPLGQYSESLKESASYLY